MRVCWSCIGVLVAACGASPREEEGQPKELVFEETFETFPAGWGLQGGGVPQTFGSDAQYGNPPPSGYISIYADAFSQTLVPFDNQSLEASFDAYITLTSYGKQQITMFLGDRYTPPTAYATLRLIWNLSADVPLPGYPAGYTVEAECDFTAPYLNDGPKLIVPPRPEYGMHALHLVIDDQGARCGVDGIDISTREDLTAVTSTLALNFDAERLQTQGTAWLDNARLLRGVP